MAETRDIYVSRIILRGIIIGGYSILGVYNLGVPRIRADFGDTERSL